MNRTIAACLALSLAPATAAFAVDTDAVLGGAVGGGLGAAVGSEIGGRSGAVVGGALGAAVGTAVMTNDNEKSSSPPTQVYRVEPSPKPEVVYVEAPPPKVLYVRESRHRHIPPGHAKHWKKHKYRYK